MSSQLSEDEAKMAKEGQRKAGWRLIASLLSGIAVPLMENHVPILTSTPITPFRLLGLYYTARLLPPIFEYIREPVDDRQFLVDLGIYDLALRAFFAPWLASRVLKVIWPQRWLAATALVLPTVVLAALPDVYRRTSWTKVVFWGRSFFNSWSGGPISIRGIFMRLYEPWRISVYQETIQALKLNGADILARSNSEDGHIPKAELYEYDTLEPEHIRLLVLHKRDRERLPCCHLEQVNIKDAPSFSFQALSYAWGKEPPSIPLMIQDQPLLVTSAVLEVLAYEWSSSSTKYLWIDAVSINQGNDEEKSVQIPLMTNIYRSAHRVLVWLSPPESAPASRLFRSAVLDLGLFKSLSYLSGPNFYTALTRSAAPSPIHLAMLEFIGQPWFSRVWIIQEMALASNIQVLYKGTRFAYRDIEKLLYMVLDSPGQHLLMYQSSFHAKKTSEIGHADPSIDIDASGVTQRARHYVSLLHFFRQTAQSGGRTTLQNLLNNAGFLLFQCHDRRDRIYGMYGLLDNRTAQSIKVSYKKPVAQLSKEVGMQILSSKDWFENFQIASQIYTAKDKRSPDLPSWIFDLSKELTPESIQAFPAARTAMFSRDRDGVVTFTADPNILEIKCSVIGLVQEVGPALLPSHQNDVYRPRPFTDSTDREESPRFQMVVGSSITVYQKTIKAWYLPSLKVARNLLRKLGVTNDDTADDLFWQTWTFILQEKLKSTARPIIHPISQAARKHFEFGTFGYMTLVDGDQVFQFAAPVGLNLSQQYSAELYAWITRELDWAFEGRRLCSISTGYLAMLPQNAELGDIVVHFRGGYMPVVLRKTSGDERRAEFVGVCHVNGVENVHWGNDWESWLLE